MAQRIAALTTNKTRPYEFGIIGDNNQQDFATAIFIDGQDASVFRSGKVNGKGLSGNRWDRLNQFLDGAGFDPNLTNGTRSRISDDLFVRVTVKDNSVL